MRLSKKAFDRIVKRSIKRIPREIGCHLDNLLISVLWRPSPDMIEEMGLEPDEPLLCLYHGVSLMDRSVVRLGVMVRLGVRSAVDCWPETTKSKNSDPSLTKSLHG